MHRSLVCFSNNKKCSVRITGGLRVEPPPHLADPLPMVKNRLRGANFSPHLSFAEVGMLLDSHFLLMQFLKYLKRDDLNVTTILSVCDFREQSEVWEHD